VRCGMNKFFLKNLWLIWQRRSTRLCLAQGDGGDVLGSDSVDGELGLLQK